MAIVDPSPTGPLTQGDLLSGVHLFVTSEENGPYPLDEGSLCVVLSRNCNALRGETIIVAAVEAYSAEKFKPISDGSFDDARKRFDAIRDGDRHPDTVYIGTIPGHGSRRFAISLKHLHSVDVPKEQSSRDAWIEEHRCGRLSADHRRHLAARLFSAVASEGFDDFRWWADEDLKLLLSVGVRQQAELQATIGQLDATILGADNLPPSEKPKEQVIANHRSNLANRQEELRKLVESLREYEAEATRRGLR